MTTTALILSPSPSLVPGRLFAPTPKAARCVLEFFTAQINNDHTRKAYLNAARRFAQWCEAHGLHELAHVQPFHVAALVKGRAGVSALLQLIGQIATEPQAAQRTPGSSSQWTPSWREMDSNYRSPVSGDTPERR